LLSSRYQDAFALLVPSCCDKSGTSCYHLVDDGNRLATIKLFQQVVTSCYKLVITTVASLLASSTWLQMIRTCSRLVNNWEQAVRTHLVEKLREFYACTSVKFPPETTLGCLNAAFHVSVFNLYVYTRKSLGADYMGRVVPLCRVVPANGELTFELRLHAPR
jgi:hypothetical protein